MLSSPPELYMNLKLLHMINSGTTALRKQHACVLRTHRIYSTVWRTHVAWFSLTFMRTSENSALQPEHIVVAPKIFSNLKQLAISNKKTKLSERTQRPLVEHLYSRKTGQYSCRSTGTILPLFFGVRQWLSRNRSTPKNTADNIETWSPHETDTVCAFSVPCAENPPVSDELSSQIVSYTDLPWSLLPV